MYSTHNEGKLVVAERLIKILKGKIYKRTTANDNESYLIIMNLGFLNKLVDEYNITYHRSIIKKSINADYSALTKNIEMNRKFKVGDRAGITKYKNIF